MMRIVFIASGFFIFFYFLPYSFMTFLFYFRISFFKHFFHKQSGTERTWKKNDAAVSACTSVGAFKAEKALEEEEGTRGGIKKVEKGGR